MNIYLKVFNYLVLSLSLMLMQSNSVFAAVNTVSGSYAAKQQVAVAENAKPASIHSKSVIEQREKKENLMFENNFAITLYKPTYLMPYYYTASPDNPVYKNNTPYDESIKHPDVKYQISFKVPMWKDILRRPVSLYLAYTQLSYWQVYNKHAFFRETDYEPEIFLANDLNFHITRSWHLDNINIGAVHQSNGFGNALERTWNRAYLEVIFSSPHWMVDLKPWLILHDGSFNKLNPHLPTYLGYGRLLLAYKTGENVFALSTHNLIEGHARYATGEFTWSFPLTTHFKGYLQVFSGYGQSLIEYNHRTNSVGFGLALNDWI